MNRNKTIAAISAIIILLAGAIVPASGADRKKSSVKKEVVPGVEVLEKRGFPGLKGKNVGLVTNPSGVDRSLRSTIDILFNAPEVNLVALFGPEHGVRGDVYAGGKVDGHVDSATGLPVHSLYGATRKPTPEMLEGIDVMVYDIQDVGARSYTFISTLGLVMEACAEQGIEVMVLDRPNPLGGDKIEGSYVEEGYFSFVSQYRIPYVYGLTVGELALMINAEGLNRGQLGNQEAARCSLIVIPMEGWRRSMRYGDTGLPWVLPSPNIPYSSSSERHRLYSAVSGVCGRVDRRPESERVSGCAPSAWCGFQNDLFQSVFRPFCRTAGAGCAVFLHGLRSGQNHRSAVPCDGGHSGTVSGP